MNGGEKRKRRGRAGWKALNKDQLFYRLPICLLLEYFIIITTDVARLQYRHSKYNPESLKCSKMSLLLHNPVHL